jgi:hypothetical protein
LGAQEYKVIEGDKDLFRYKSGKVKKINTFFGPCPDMEEVEFWEERLTKFGIKYCLVHRQSRGYSIFLDPDDFNFNNKANTVDN